MPLGLSQIKNNASGSVYNLPLDSSSTEIIVDLSDTISDSVGDSFVYATLKDTLNNEIVKITDIDIDGSGRKVLTVERGQDDTIALDWSGDVSIYQFITAAHFTEMYSILADHDSSITNIISGNTQFDSLSISTDLDLSGTLYSSNLNISSFTTGVLMSDASGDISSTMTPTLTSLVLSSTLDVTGAATLRSTLAVTSTSTLTGNVTVGGNAVSNPILYINGAAGSNRELYFLSGGVARWILRCTSTAEGGADAGSDLILSARADAGSAIDTVLSINRLAGGSITTPRPFIFGSTIDVTGASTLRSTLAVTTSIASPLYSSTVAAGIWHLNLDATGKIGFKSYDGTERAWYRNGANVFEFSCNPVPATDNQRTLGSTSLRWSTIYGVNQILGGTLDVTGAATLRASVQIGGGSLITDSIVGVYSSNTSNAAGLVIEQASTGDSALTWLLSGGQSYSMGIDNSDSDSWVLSRGSAIGTNNVIKMTTGGSLSFYGTSTFSSAVTFSSTIQTTQLYLNWTTGALVTSGNFPVIYASDSTGSAPFNEAGHLIIQSRPSTLSRNIYLVTGATPAIRMTIADAGVSIVGTLDSTGAFAARAAVTVGTTLDCTGAATFRSTVLSTSHLTIGSDSATASLYIKGASTDRKQILFQSGGYTKWNIVGGYEAAGTFTIQNRDSTGALIDNPISIADSTAGAITIGRPTSFSSTSSHTGAATFGSTIDVTGASTFRSAMTNTNGYLYLGVSSSVRGVITCYGDAASASGNLTLYNRGDQTGSTQTWMLLGGSNGTFQIAGFGGSFNGGAFLSVSPSTHNITFIRNCVFSQQIDCTGTLSARAAVTIGTTLDVTGNATLRGTLAVTSTSTLTGSVGIGAASTANSRLHVSGGTSQWSASNYGAGITITGTRNNALAILSPSSDTPWGIIHNTSLKFSAMPELGDTTSAPVDCMVITRAGAVTILTSLTVTTSAIVKTTLDVTGALSARAAVTIGTTLDCTGNATLRGTVSITKALYKGTSTLTDATSIATDASLGNLFYVTLAASRTMANPSNPINGQQLIYFIKQGGTGSYTITWGSAFQWSTTVPQPTLSTAVNAVDMIMFIYDSTASKWRATSTNLGHAT